jgi:hypothetical protein
VIFWGVVTGFVIAVITKTATDASAEEVRTRLGRLPQAMLAIAARALPKEERDDLLAEWGAELGFILRHTGGLPLTRLCRGLRFALGLVLAAPALGRERGIWLRITQVGATALGVSISGFGIFTLLDGTIGYALWSFSELTSRYEWVGLRTCDVIDSLWGCFFSLGIVFFGVAVGVFGVVVPWLDDQNVRILNFPVDMVAFALACLGVSGMLSGSVGFYYTGWLGDGGSSLAGTILGCLTVAAAMVLRSWWRRHAAPFREARTASAAS